MWEMKEVVFDKAFLASASKEMELYFMFRGVSKSEEDERRINKMGLRYDITIIPPNTLGSEFVKTAGHYHPTFSDGSDLTFPEIYEVLEGEAHYLLQRREEGKVQQREKVQRGEKVQQREKVQRGEAEKITDVVVVKAEEGDKVLIPPNYGHVTINPSEKKETLKMANWVASGWSSIYEPIKRKGGAAYFELTSGEFVKNENYGAVPEIRFLKASGAESASVLKELGLSREQKMYELIEEPEKLEFLTNPTFFHKESWVKETYIF